MAVRADGGAGFHVKIRQKTQQREGQENGRRAKGNGNGEEQSKLENGRAMFRVRNREPK